LKRELLTVRVSISSSLIKRFLNGDHAACARVITLIENNHRTADELISQIYSRTGKAHRIGITGPPGAGKSTLVQKLATLYRSENKKIAIIAVDPTSPFTGGAILGDRIRMSDLFTDSEVFIRSMASRGSVGGLALQTKSVCDVLDAFGKDVIFIETVGVGQVELDVAQLAHTTMVVLVPESGDSIQTMKAGLMEIADIFIINKSDRDGADRLGVSIEAMLDLKTDGLAWRPQVINTSAVQERGVEEVCGAIRYHWNFLNESGAIEDHLKENIQSEIIRFVDQIISEKIWHNDKSEKMMAKFIQEVMKGNITPKVAAKEIVKRANLLT